MANLLRVLVIEDSEADTELLLRELRRGGYAAEFQRADSEETMLAALDGKTWDIVIADYVVPGFGGMEALKLLRDRDMATPFLIVSGHIGEDIAVSAMKAGADDYLMKDRMARLVPAVERALAQAAIRCAHKRANEALCESEERFRQLAEHVGAAFFMFDSPAEDSPGLISYVSPAFEKIWGYPSAILFRNSDELFKAIHPEDRPSVLSHLPQMACENFSAEFRIVAMDLRTKWVHFRTFPVRNNAGKVYRVAAIAEETTERKLAEAQLESNARQLQASVEQLRAIGGELQQRNQELSLARAELEERVKERTAELTAANTELRAEMAERKRLENELLEIAENERRRIGFDLHDDIGQKLMGVSLLLKALETNLAHKQLPEADETRKLQQLIEQVINHTHNLAHCFSSFETHEDDLVARLKQLVVNVRKTFGIPCRLRVSGSPSTVSPDMSLQLSKIAQESVSNAIKHGQATFVQISLSQQNSQLILQIKNDGVPFPVDREPNNRMGLRIMNYRARTVGGTFEIGPDGDSGTLVTCVLPYHNRTSNGKAKSREILPLPLGSSGVASSGVATSLDEPQAVAL
jgi:PAS domain S-box-containing protein